MGFTSEKSLNLTLTDHKSPQIYVKLKKIRLFAVTPKQMISEPTFVGLFFLFWLKEPYPEVFTPIPKHCMCL